jgi:hypothetical protein
VHSVDLLACRCLGDGGGHLVSWRKEWSASSGLSHRVRVTTVCLCSSNVSCKQTASGPKSWLLQLQNYCFSMETVSCERQLRHVSSDIVTQGQLVGSPTNAAIVSKSSVILSSSFVYQS